MSPEPTGEFNPFSDAAPNPYASPPPTVGTGQDLASRDQVQRELKTPAIVLIVLALLTIALNLFGLVYNFFFLVQPDDTLWEVFLRLVGSAAIVLMNIAILIGAIGMLRLRGWRSARLAAFLAMIPLCGPLYVLGIPFGISAAAVLGRAETKQVFES